MNIVSAISVFVHVVVAVSGSSNFGRQRFVHQNQSYATQPSYQASKFIYEPLDECFATCRSGTGAKRLYIISQPKAGGQACPQEKVKNCNLGECYQPQGVAGKPTIKDHNRNHIKIEWKAPLDNDGYSVQHYDVERRDVQTSHWIKVNSGPIKRTKYLDEQVTEGHTYKYRIVAVNKPSSPSEVVTAEPMFGLAHLNALLQTQTLDNTIVDHIAQEYASYYQHPEMVFFLRSPGTPPIDMGLIMAAAGLIYQLDDSSRVKQRFFSRYQICMDTPTW